nr:MAG TPA: hypothetical protein [Caudoviricetes sp.]
MQPAGNKSVSEILLKYAFLSKADLQCILTFKSGHIIIESTELL